MSPNHDADLEHALEIVEIFTQSNTLQSVPTFEDLELQGQMLHVQERTTLEKTIAFTKDCLLRAFSEGKRKERETRKKALTQTVIRSRDLLSYTINLYTSVQSGLKNSPTPQFRERLLQAAIRYNEVVRQAKPLKQSISQKIKRFFLEAAGWNIGEEIAHIEITIPHTHERALVHKISSPVPDRTTGKITSIIQSAHILTEYEKSLPKPWEIDAFHLKSISLLQKQTALPFGECLDLVHSSPIISHYNRSDSQSFSLEQTVIPFPGSTTVIRGSFTRDPLNPQRSIPHPLTWKTLSLQPEFVDPISYIGFALNVPRVESPVFFEPHKLSNNHFALRMALFQEHGIFFLDLFQSFLEALLGKDAIDKEMVSFFSDLKKTPLGFLLLAHLHRKFLIDCSPSQQNSLEQKISYEEQLLASAPNPLKQALAWKKRRYLLTITKLLSPTMMQLHKTATANHVTSLEKRMLTSLFRQRICFINETRKLPMTKNALLESIHTDFQEEIAIYTDALSTNSETCRAQEMVDRCKLHLNFVK